MAGGAGRRRGFGGLAGLVAGLVADLVAGPADITVAEADGLAIKAALRWQHRGRRGRRPWLRILIEHNRTSPKYVLLYIARV